MPAHLKIDYNILYFKIRTVYRHALEVEVNKNTGRTAIVSAEAGTILYWPAFLLSVFSIEIPESHPQPLKEKPLDHAGDVGHHYEVLQPIAVQGDWIMVALHNEDYRQVGQGWLRWRKDSQVVVAYALLS